MINYQYLQDSINYYKSKGFTQIETPWMVAPAINNLTKTDPLLPYQLKHNNKCLVGSAEQGFLALVNKGFLSSGDYISISPCFRDDEFSLTHTKTFMKSELFTTRLVNEDKLETIIDLALVFFNSKLFDKTEAGIHKVEKVKTDIGFDIEYKGYELGSYGIRDFGFVKYLYGTACSEPRLSRVKELNNLK